MTVGKVRAAYQELGNSGELVGVETLQQRGHVFTYWVEHILDVSHSLQCWVEDLLTPIVRIRFTADVSRSLQSRDYPGDRATSHASDRGQLAADHRTALAQQVEALVIRWAQP